MATALTHGAEFLSTNASVVVPTDHGVHLSPKYYDKSRKEHTIRAEKNTKTSKTRGRTITITKSNIAHPYIIDITTTNIRKNAQYKQNT
jgi:hypothetical protein